MADIAAADSVGKGNGNAFRTQLWLCRYIYAVKILIGLLAALIRILTDRYFQLIGHIQKSPRSVQGWGLVSLALIII
jgi:hypothetical protein